MKQKGGVVFSELKRFGDLTSAKGVRRAIRSESQCLKVMWILSVVVLLAITIYNVWNLTNEYLMYHTDTKITENKIDIVQEKASDILLCNINPFSTYALNRTIKLRASYQKLISEWTSSDEEDSMAEVTLLNSIRQELLTGHSGFYQYVGSEEASRLSHTWRRFVISCQVYFLDGVMEKSIPCVLGNFRIERSMHKDYFNCYRIFGRENKSSRPVTGMSFLLYIDDVNKHDVSSQNKGKGAILTIGERGTFLNPNTEGVEILPGYVSTIKFEPVHRKRLPKPHGGCVDRDNYEGHKDDTAVHQTYKLGHTYTEEACISACIEYKIIQICKCHDIGQYGILLDFFGNISMCGNSNQGRKAFLDKALCVQKWRSKFRKQCLMKCPPPCRDKRFDKSVTYLEISQEHIDKNLNEEKQRSSVPGLYKQDDDKVFDYENLNRSKFAWVYLKRERTSYFVVEDTVGMTISDWLAKVGGAMNLWSGITVFVFVEIADLLCRLVRNIFNSEIQNEQKEQSTVACHCECHCFCRRKDSLVKGSVSMVTQPEDRYVGQYGNINSSFE